MVRTRQLLNNGRGIPVSSFLMGVMVLCSMLSLGYFQSAPFYFYGYSTRIIVAVMGLILAAVVAFIPDKNRMYRSITKGLNQYMLPYMICVFITLITAVRKYGYSPYEVLLITAPYMLVAYAYPIVYVISNRDTLMRVWKIFARVEVGILFLKTASWYLYNFTGSAFLSEIAIEYGTGWTRGGLQRVEQGALFGVAYAYYLHQFATSRKHKTANLMKVLLFVLYSAVITQFRTLTIYIVLALIVIMFFSQKKLTPLEFIRKMTIIIIIGTAAIVAVPMLLESFSTHGALGGSTSYRMVTLGICTNLMKQEKAWFGLGLLDTLNKSVASQLSMMGHVSYLEDLGVLSGFIRFGLLSFFVYGIFIVETVKMCIYTIRHKTEDIAFVLGLGSYILVSMPTMNVFDHQRAFAMPFYLAAIYYYKATRRRVGRNKRDTVTEHLY